MSYNAFLLVTIAGSLAAAPAPDDPAAAFRLEAHANAEPIALDGRLDEPAWQRAEVATGFTQREPTAGEPATERTEVRIVYDERTLYVGLYAFDRQPAAIIAKEMQRDGGLRNDDSFIVLLDTFDDDRNAYFFEVNANGARTDSLISDEGRDMNFEWDGVWNVVTRRAEDGWVAEIAIPFSTLRFDPGASAWGLNFRRLIRHKNEDVYWAPILLDASLSRVSRYGSLHGLESVDPGLNLNVKPFLAGSDRGGTGDGSELESGLDVKWGVTRGLSLDLTVNTDFAETEVDDEQVNLTRFSLFFPEKREFFLENAGIFEFGTPGPGRGAPLLKVFFSRRIGIEDGEEVPIDWGARLSGRAGSWNLGLLNVQTAARGPAADDALPVPQTDWTALRLKRNVGQRSSVGVIATAREGDGHNRVYGVDFDLKPREELGLIGFFAQSDDSELASGADWTAGLRAAWEGTLWDWQAEVIEVGERFEPDMGFLLRRGVRRYNGELSFEPRPDWQGVRNLSFELEAELFTDRDGRRLSEEMTLDVFGLELDSEDSFTFYIERKFEHLVEPFEVVPEVIIPPGDYPYYDYGILFRTNSSRKFSVSGFLQTGEFFDGDRDAFRLSLEARPNRFVRSETSWNRNDVEMLAGSFATNILRQRLGLAWSPRLRTDTFVQYNDLSELFGINIRLNWIYRPGADLFVVFNQNWDAPSLSSLARRDRQLILKFTYLYQR